MRIVQAQFALNTTIGDQDLNVSGTQTPIGVILQGSSATTSGTPVAGSVLFFGLSDGTTSVSGSAFSQDSSATNADTGGRSSSTAILEICVPTGTGRDATATFVQWNNSGGNVGVRINLSDAPATSLICNATFFFPDTGNEAVAVRAFTPSATQNVSNTISTPSGPTALIAYPGALGATFNNLRLSRGFAAKVTRTTSTQGNSAYFESDAANPTACTQEFSTTYVHTVVGGAAYEVTTWSNTTVSITTRRAAASSPMYVFVLCTPAPSFVAATSIGTNATGNKDVTAPGFPADSVFAVGTKVDTLDTVETDTTAGLISIGIGTFRTSMTQFCSAFQSLDNASAPNQDTSSVVDSKLVRVIDIASADDWAASLVSSLPTGFRINVSTASSADRKWVYMALGTTGDMVHHRRYFFRQSIRM